MDETRSAKVSRNRNPARRRTSTIRPPTSPPEGTPPPMTGERPGSLASAGSRGPSTPEPATQGGAGKWVLRCFSIIAAAVIGFLLWKRSGEHKAARPKTTHDLAQNHVIFTRIPAPPARRKTRLSCRAISRLSTRPRSFARTNGYLKAWYVDIGAKVTEGQVLADIEAPDVDAQLRQTSASLSPGEVEPGNREPQLRASERSSCEEGRRASRSSTRTARTSTR